MCFLVSIILGPLYYNYSPKIEKVFIYLGPCIKYAYVLFGLGAEYPSPKKVNLWNYSRII